MKKGDICNFIWLPDEHKEALAGRKGRIIEERVLDSGHRAYLVEVVGGLQNDNGDEVALYCSEDALQVILSPVDTRH